MKGEKGITLISVVIYLIAMVIIIALIASLSGYFYKNININNETQDINLQYSRFNSYFTEDINKRGNSVYKIGYSDNDGLEANESNYTQHYILFTSGNQYTFIKQKVDENGNVTYGAIYLDNVKIVSNITNCKFESEELNNGNTNVTVTIEGNNNFKKQITYTMK